MGFEVAPAFEAGSLAAAEWPLCHVRLQDDARFPWLILIPCVEGAVELEDLSVEQRTMLMEETVRAGALVRRLGAVEKLNVGAIGNVTAQLHVHVVGRRRDDSLWPDPVWGRGPVVPYTDDERARRLAIVAGG
ncbi:HIT domain-containing protein [Brevundimonas fontaquae]|uniref:HIT domain-containing protein n=2 Tax=Brevundimonas fontaquae TaxID=2813778 RepID=A0ABX7LRX7_9CAUL|nr:HIT family protein [Brevundimonas fontaquae]QSF54899.1 HIT domain-containing protein [Brevundimonas fontaquae]